MDRKSKYKGVKFRRSLWNAQIVHEYKTYYLGTYSTEIEAAVAYNQAAKQLHGEFSCLNEGSELEGVEPKKITLQSNNKSGYRGVSYHRVAKKWRASIGRNYIGLFDTPKSAANAIVEHRKCIGET